MYCPGGNATWAIRVIGSNKVLTIVSAPEVRDHTLVRTGDCWLFVSCIYDVAFKGVHWSYLKSINEYPDIISHW